nr:hypothetical protein [Tanacetum cinerariifolium]
MELPLLKISNHNANFLHKNFRTKQPFEDLRDGEITMQYTKLVWKFHRDNDKALTYFEKAVFAALKTVDLSGIMSTTTFVQHMW